MSKNTNSSNKYYYEKALEQRKEQLHRKSGEREEFQTLLDESVLTIAS